MQAEKTWVERTDLPLLTHWTGMHGVEVVIKILQGGFQMPAHNRKVMTKLCPDLKLRKEPQAFGMVSFTDIELAQSGRLVQSCGPFGIVMSPFWSSWNGARKVRYVCENDPDFKDLQRQYETAAQEVNARIRYPEDAGWQLAHQNSNMASFIGAHSQVHFLRKLEFMQDAEFSWESEWRIVQSQPFSFQINKEAKKENGEIKRRDEQLADFQKGWGRPGNAIRVSVDVTPDDVFRIWCPEDELPSLQEALQTAGLAEAYLEHCTPYDKDKLTEIE